MSILEEVLALFERRGAGAYFGEAVSMTEHGLQAAHFAAQEGAPPWLQLAALLHDVGHLVVSVPDALEDWTSDAQHEESGARWLLPRFGARIAEPVRLHVPAKRYLCGTDPAYFARLSPASVHTLRLQGGPMSAAEARRFEALPFHREAVRVRRWDDQGKIAGLATAGLAQYRGLIESLASQAGASPERTP